MTRRFFILLHCLVVMITASAQDAMVTKFANIPCDSDELLLKTIPYFNIKNYLEKMLSSSNSSKWKIDQINKLWKEFR